MQPSAGSLILLSSDQCQRAARARDPRFDGVFFIGVTTTGIYCRPICPGRFVRPTRRRFFVSAAAAERAGYRPCLRCRPELAPGRAPVDAVSRLAFAAALRIAAGALNDGSVADLARELGVSARHLRRALERQLGVSPVELAQTHRLLLAKRLLADTALPVTHVAFASGFQSLRRFNTVFRERYHLSPSRLRRAARGGDERRRTGARAAAAVAASPDRDFVRLTLGYREPLAWNVLLRFLERDAIPGVEIVRGSRYGRTVRVDGRSGVVFAALVARRRGVRIPGAFDSFEIVLGALIRGPRASAHAARDAARRVVAALGEPLDTGVPGLDRLAPTADRVAEAGAARLGSLGVAPGRALALAAAARAIASGQLALAPGGDIVAARRALRTIDGIGDRLATEILVRTLCWPDAFPAGDRALQRAAGVSGPGSLRARAESWRPWRAYAALHLRLQDTER